MNRSKNFLRHHPITPTMNRTIILSLFLILFCAWPVWGATYYVKNGGNDNLDGLSDVTAWATISKVQSTVTNGDTVYFRSQDTWTSSLGQVLNATVAGVTYDGSTYGSGTRATFQATGTLDAVVKLSANNLSFSGFDIDMNSQITGGIYVGTFATSNKANFTVHNCKVHDNSVPSGYFRYGVHVGGYANTNVIISNVTLTDNEIYNTGHEGLALYPTWTRDGCGINGLTARNNIIHDTGQSGSYKAGIYLANNADNVTLEFNTIYNAGNGINIVTSGDARPDCAGIGSPNGLIARYNLVYNNNYGIYMQPQCGMQGDGSIYDNLILNSTGADIYIAADDTTYNWGTSAFNFYNNTIYNTVNYVDSTSYTVVVAEYYQIYGTPTFTFKNNIIYTSRSTPLRDKNNYLVHSNNLIFNAYGTSSVHISSGGTNYNRAGVTTWEPTAQNTDPTFTGGTLPTGFTGTYRTNMVPNTDYFAITSGNALNNGVTLGSSYNGCINGAGLAAPILRPQGAAYDIGAYEYVDTIRLAPPIGLRILPF